MPGFDSSVKQAASSETAETRVGADEVRLKLGELLDRAWDGERLIVTRHERERAVILGWREYERLREIERSVA